ncbi:MAG: preprotein translocase subunit SecY [Myxococcota bacterium]|nr:preprotein translocase subunit SecY [Myxococcota bacterium]
MFSSISAVFKLPSLRNRILFTLAMLAIYRLGIFIPSPGIDRDALSEFFSSSQGSLLSLYNMFSGGALERFSVFVLGIMPYISASIIMQLAQVIFPKIERLKSEGQAGRKKINQYTRYLTIGIAIVQSFTISISLETMSTTSGTPIVLEGGWWFTLMTVITMTSGSCFVMWLGEQITERGIGQGASLIITAGIIAAIPSGAQSLYQNMALGEISLLSITLLLLFMCLVVAAIVYVERGLYQVPIRFPKRVGVGGAQAGGQNTHLPLKVNVAGVIPPIFASSLMFFPATISTLFPNDFFQLLSSVFIPGTWTYLVSYIFLIVAFTFFYAAITFNPTDLADNLRKQGGFIPNVRPGPDTVAKLDYILIRLTAGGAVYLSVVCILPEVLAQRYNIPFYFGGTGLLIIVGVCMHTVAQIEGYMLSQQYDGLESQKKGGGRREKFSIQR